MFLVYKNHEIVSSGDNFKVKTPRGEYWKEVAASISTAKKWIDASMSEKAATANNKL